MCHISDLAESDLANGLQNILEDHRTIPLGYSFDICTRDLRREIEIDIIFLRLEQEVLHGFCLKVT